MSPLIVLSTKHSVTKEEKRLLLFNIHRLVRAANFGPGILRSGERTSRLIICRDDQDFCLVVRLGLSPALSLQEQRHMQAIWASWVHPSWTWTWGVGLRGKEAQARIHHIFRDYINPHEATPGSTVTHARTRRCHDALMCCWYFNHDSSSAANDQNKLIFF